MADGSRMTRKRLRELIEKRGDLSSNLANDVKKLSQLMSREGAEVHVVLQGYNYFISRYKLLLKIHEEVQACLVSEKDRNKDDEYFQAPQQIFVKLLENVKGWLFERGVKMPTRQAKGKEETQVAPQVLDTSSVSVSVSEQMSVIRAEAKARWAELKARTELFQETRKLEEEKLKLRLSEEEMKLKTELKIAEARSKVFENENTESDGEPERTCVWAARQGEPHSNPVGTEPDKHNMREKKAERVVTGIVKQKAKVVSSTSDEKQRENVGDRSSENKSEPEQKQANADVSSEDKQPRLQQFSRNWNVKAPTFTPAAVHPGPVSDQHRPVDGSVMSPQISMSFSTPSSSGTGYHSDPIMNVVQELRKPQVEIQPFSGDPLTYLKFIRQFNAKVVVNASSDAEKLTYLEQFTTGEAKKIVNGYCNLDPTQACEAIQSEFDERYGDSEIVANAYVNRALKWDEIKDENDVKKLDDFAIFLVECLNAIKCLDAVRLLNFPQNIQSLVNKLPPLYRGKWRNHMFKVKKSQPIHFSTFVDFLRDEVRKITDPFYGKLALDSVKQGPQAYQGKSNKAKPKIKAKVNATNANSNPKVNVSRTRAAFVTPCAFCNDNSHALAACKIITDKPYQERFEFLKKLGVCFACLDTSHRGKHCRVKNTCANCPKRHHTILHSEQRPTSNMHETVNKSSGILGCSTGVGEGECTMVIIPVVVKGKNGVLVETYAFLDPGCDVSLCTQKLASQLGIPGKKTSVSVDTLTASQVIHTRKVSGLQIAGIHGDNFISLPTLYTQNKMPVTQRHMPSQNDISKWEHLKDLSVSTLDTDVNILIGNNVPDAYRPLELRTGPPGSPHATRSVLGWIFWNVIRDRKQVDSDSLSLNRIALEEIQNLESLVRASMDHDFPERCLDTKKESSVEDKLFEERMAASLKFQDGHYYMDLPLRDMTAPIQDNKAHALKQLNSTKRKMQRDAKFASDYIAFMNNMFDKGYAVKLSPQASESSGCWYIPHHGIYHRRKNKIRVVFHCSDRYMGVSLNDRLLQGPNLTNTVVDVLLRFRQEPVGIMSDIEGFFFQARVTDHLSDRFLRFFWWPQGDVSKDPEIYKMVGHLFGAVSSPACANYALRQTAKDHASEFSNDVITSVSRNFYVDDFCKSVPTVDKAISLSSDLMTLLKRGGFRLTGWISNKKAVNDAIPLSERAKSLQLQKDLESPNASPLPTERALGVFWDAETDTFGFRLNLKEKPHTKRGLLSVMSSVFDPLGIASPMVLPARILIQNLFKKNIGWDDKIDEEDEKRWLLWLSGISELENISVPRCLKPENFGNVVSCQLHAFSDASDQGYGIALYTRLRNEDGQISCNLLLGKSRVAPLKKITVPRMELTAACIAVKFVNIVTREMDYEFDRVCFWTDSMSVLRYIKNTTSRFHTFVANRLTTIHEGSSPDQWRYVPTSHNPADIASRGLNLTNVKSESNLERWLHGPEFLVKPESEWPEVETSEDVPKDDPEVKVIASTMVEDSVMENLFTRFSSFSKLRTTVAWLLRGKVNLQRKLGDSTPVIENTASEKLTSVDLDSAEIAIVKYLQRRYFPENLKEASVGVQKLDPFRDSDGIIRVGGRLSRAAIPADTKHPILLPKESPVSRLYIEFLHRSLGHSGSNTVLTKLRQKYWLPRAGVIIRSVIAKCVICRRYRAKLRIQKMADLLTQRVVFGEAPFSNSGVDYFGPFEIKRGRSVLKRYGVLFTCFNSRAVHLEIAHSLDTSSCINAIRRFVARRGPCKRLRSDNGTNLVGAQRELKEQIDQWNHAKIESELRQEGILWDFNAPSSSHHGGVWERMIRTVRKVLYGLMKEQNIKLDDEGLQTLFCEVEAIVNNRPITKLSSDPSDLQPLSPSQLLLAHKSDLCAPPPGVFSKDDNYARRKWRQIQHLTNVFWKRWSREYLTSLQERSKWLKEEKNVQVGDIVLVADNSDRNQWPMGKVVKVFPDKDGLVRIVHVKTKTNILERPITKLCVLLEVDSE